MQQIKTIKSKREQLLSENSITQLHNLTPQLLGDLIDQRFDKQFERLKENVLPKPPPKYVTRSYLANEVLHCDLSTIHNLTVRGVLTKYGIGGKVLYKLSEAESAIIKLT